MFVCYMDNLIHTVKDDVHFGNYFSLAFAVDFIAYYLHDEHLSPLKNTVSR